MVRGIFGLEPNKLETNIIRLSAGSMSAFDGAYTVDWFTNPPIIDLNYNGAWGLDVGTPSNGDLFLYLIKNSIDDTGAFIASKSKFQGGVVVPTDYTIDRKFPWGVVYNSSWDGIPNHHISHWPSPSIDYTDWETTPEWQALTSGKATDWTDIDLSPWIPDNCRLAKIYICAKYIQGATSFYLRSYPAQTNGQRVASVSSASVYSDKLWEIRTSSTRKIQYKANNANSEMSVFVRGYNQTEQA